MHPLRLSLRRAAPVALVAVTLLIAGAAHAQRQPTSVNPTADSVNEETLFKTQSQIQGRISIPDVKATMVEHPRGRDWRAFREVWLPWLGGLAVLGTLALLGLFFLWRGRVRLAPGDWKGIAIARFNAIERLAHWTTASCFIVLALTGLNYVFGKRILAPLFGEEAFAAASQWGKYAHNFLAWPFMLGVLVMLVAWLRDNIPNRIDVAWIKAGGGIVGSGHPSAERFNAGQKGVFWMVMLCGAGMSASGLLLLFPFSVTDINGMELAEVAHALIAVLFIAGILAHIYIGTLGMEGAFDAMGKGEVDLGWAEKHHNLWVADQQAKGLAPRDGQTGSGGGPHPAPAE
jgi:formate dehydrogenase subunit gamma